MRSSPFENFHIQMGVTVMGFAEHFGQGLPKTTVNLAAQNNV